MRARLILEKISPIIKGVTYSKEVEDTIRKIVALDLKELQNTNKIATYELAPVKITEIDGQVDIDLLSAFRLFPKEAQEQAAQFIFDIPRNIINEFTYVDGYIKEIKLKEPSDDYIASRCAYKAWNKITKKMQFVDSLTYTNGNVSSVIVNNENIPLQDIILLQCTGIRDMYGSPIYEGDIVIEYAKKKRDGKPDPYKAKRLVCWDKKGWNLGVSKAQGRSSNIKNKLKERSKYPNCLVAFSSYTSARTFRNCEIIGNVYENEQLLK